MSSIAVTTARASVHEPRRLTIAELERYVRRGCVCSVCEFARAEIGVLQKEASRIAESSVDGSVRVARGRPISVEATDRLVSTFQRFKSTLASWREAWGSKWGKVSTITARKS